jgi:hypothetical protein
LTMDDAKKRSNINIAGRVNRVVASNIGGDGSSHAVSSRQHVRIRQDRTGTYEDVETIERSVGPADGPETPVEPGTSQER